MRGRAGGGSGQRLTSWRLRLRQRRRGWLAPQGWLAKLAPQLVLLHDRLLLIAFLKLMTPPPSPHAPPPRRPAPWSMPAACLSSRGGRA